MIIAEEIARRMIGKSRSCPALSIRRFIGSDLFCCYLLTLLSLLASKVSTGACGVCTTNRTTQSISASEESLRSLASEITSRCLKVLWTYKGGQISDKGDIFPRKYVPVERQMLGGTYLLGHRDKLCIVREN